MTHLDDTIALLSKDVHMNQSTKYFGRTYAILTLTSMIIVTGLTILASMGNWLAFRPDYFQMMSDFDIALYALPKQALPALIILFMLFDLRRSIYPEQINKGWLIVMGAIPFFCLPLLLLITLSTNDISQWKDMIIGGSLIRCIILIPMLALIILSAQIFALTYAAPQRPIWLGCRAGLIAGSAATIIYAFYCTEDSPAFYGLWYASGIAMTAGMGALAGRIFLRW